MTALDYIETAKNLADPFTKGLSRIVIENASREMGHGGNPTYVIGDPVN